MVHRSRYCSPPEDAQTTIWRYMNWRKFESLVTESSLFFCRSTELEDKLEGVFTSPVRAQVEALFAQEASEDPSGELDHHIQKSKETVWLSCWHINDAESAKMWKKYTNDDPESIVIRSSYAKLRDVLKPYGADVEIGKVEYVDHATHDPGHADSLGSFYQKDVQFRYENELRALYLRFGDEWPDGLKPAGPGVLVPVNLESLIDEVVTHPNANKDQVERTQLFLRSHGFSKMAVLGSPLRGP